MTAEFAIGLLALKAEMNLSNRFRHDLSAMPSRTPQERIASGMYASVRGPDGLDHAANFPDYLADVREAIDLIGGREHARGQLLLSTAHYRKMLCDLELHAGGLEAIKSWSPSKMSCPACIARC